MKKTIELIDRTIQIVFRCAIKEKDKDTYQACIQLANDLVKFRTYLEKRLESGL